MFGNVHTQEQTYQHSHHVGCRHSEALACPQIVRVGSESAKTEQGLDFWMAIENTDHLKV